MLELFWANGFSEVLFFKAAWFIFFGITISKIFTYKTIASILESYILWRINTSRIGLLSKLDIFEVNKMIYLWTNKKTNQTASWECIEKGIVCFRPPNK